MRVRASLLVVAILSGLSACSSDESDGGGTSSSCASDPLSCGAGKTCWVVNASGTYDCIAATTDKPQGSPCQNTVGVAQCNEGLMCFPGQQGSATGSCEPFCAKDGTCSSGAACAQVSLINAPNAPVIRACAPTGSGGSGGTAGSGSGGTAGSGSGGKAGSGSGGTAGSGSGGKAGSGSGGTAGSGSGGTAGSGSGGKAGSGGAAGSGAKAGSGG